MHPHVLRQLRMEGCGHYVSLAHGNGIAAFRGDHLDARSHTLDFRGADEDHFSGRAGKYSLPDRAVDLASVGVAADGDIESAQSRLGWILDLAGQQDCPGAGSERGLDADKLVQFLESKLAEKLEEGAGLASGNDQAVDLFKLFRLFDEYNFGAQLFQPSAVRIEIALQGQNTDLHMRAAGARPRKPQG